MLGFLIHALRWRVFLFTIYKEIIESYLMKTKFLVHK